MYPLDFLFEIHTERLTLRLPRVEDLDEWAAFCADPVTMRFLGGPKSRSEAWREMMSITGAWGLLGFSMFSVVERATGAWVGRVGPWYPADWPGREVGWGIARCMEGRGYATEAAAAAIDWAVDRLGWEDFIHVIEPDNAGSIAVARRLGSVNDGPTRLPPPHDDVRVDRWGQSADAWRARQGLRRRPTNFAMSTRPTSSILPAPTRPSTSS